MNLQKATNNSRFLAVVTSLALAVVLLALSLAMATGSTQSGDVSGTVFYFGGAEEGSYDHINLDALINLGGPAVGDVNIDKPGDYTIFGLPDGQYYICASIDPLVHAFTCHDRDRDGEPDQIEVAGGDVTGIDIGLGGPWLPTGGPIAPGGQVLGLAVHPSISDTVYAAVSSIGSHDSGPSVIYKSTNGADSWTPVYTAEHQIYSLATAGSNVYAGAFNPNNEREAIYLSQNNGLSWTPVFSFTNRGVWLDISIHPTDADKAIIGGWVSDNTGTQQSGLVYETGDGGLTWTSSLTVTLPDTRATLMAVMIHPVTPTLMMASVRGDDSSDSFLYRSDNSGANWSKAWTFPDAHVISLAANTSDPNIIYAGAGFSNMSWGRAVIFRSTDAGLTWSQVSDNGTYLAFAPPSTVYSAMDSGEIVVSSANGDLGSWNVIAGQEQPLSFDIDLGHTNTTPPLYLGGSSEGVHKSVDGGFNWQDRSDNIETTVPPRDIDVDPQDLDKLFAAASDAGGWLSTDGGVNWTKINDRYSLAFAINPENPDIVYAGDGNNNSGAIRRSDDGGLNFTEVYTAPFIKSDGSGGNEEIRTLAIAPSDTNVVYAAGQDQPNYDPGHAVVLRTRDDGDSWDKVLALDPQSVVEVLAIDPTDADTVYAGGEDCSGPDCKGFIYRTTDGGVNWTSIFTPDRTVRSILVDYLKPQVLYASTQGYSIYKSDDYGDNWDSIRDCCPSGNLLALDPNVPSHIYLGGWGYIAESYDGGLTWDEGGSPINAGTPGMEPRSLVVDTGTVTQTLYAGFTGVWKYGRPAIELPHVYLPVVLKQ